MMELALLCGVFAACGVYLVLAQETWRRLAGLVLIGDAVALLAVSAGGGGAAASRVGVALVLASFALFLARAALARPVEKKTRAGAGENDRAW